MKPFGIGFFAWLVITGIIAVCGIVAVVHGETDVSLLCVLLGGAFGMVGFIVMSSNEPTESTGRRVAPRRGTRPTPRRLRRQRHG